MKISISKVNSIPVLKITGELTGKSVVKCALKLDNLRESTTAAVAIDLSATTFIDSSGLGAFVYSWQMLKNDHRELILINPQGFMLSLLQSTNLVKVFKIIGSREEL